LAVLGGEKQSQLFRIAFCVLRNAKWNLKKQSQFVRSAFCVVRIAKSYLKKQSQNNEKTGEKE
jgi:hypothetical protein